MIEQYGYFFDAQMKRYLMQVERAFSGIQYATGRTIDGKPELLVVPCRMALRDRVVATLIHNGSENALNTVPLITVARSGLALDKAAQGPASHVSTVRVAEQGVTNGKYNGQRGQAYTIERLMPRAFVMNVQVDIWTSNLDQQDQILEQLLVIMAVPFDIQNSDNALDWSALTTMELEDITPSSKSVNIGTEDDIDVATLTFRIPILLNPPAKITRQILIGEVVTNVQYKTDAQPDQIVVTPNNYQIAVQRGIVTLLTSGATEADADGRVPTWDECFSANRGRLVPTKTQLRLRRDLNDDTRDIIGTLQKSPDANRLYWQIDPETLPSNTFSPIDAIVRPLSAAPGVGLPAASAGQRYLVYEDISSSQNWGAVNAKRNDIIEYKNGAWVVAMKASEAPHGYVLNQSTSSQLYWDGEDWQKSIDRIYGPGHWRIYF